jgi:SH3-like domain-containing protein
MGLEKAWMGKGAAGAMPLRAWVFMEVGQKACDFSGKWCGYRPCKRKRTYKEAILTQEARRRTTTGLRFVGLVAAFFWLAPLLHAAERMTVERSIINVRSGPGTEHSTLWQAEANYPVEVLERRNNWVRFRDFEGYEGWVAENLLGRTPAVVVKSARANVRSGPGTGHPIVFTVEKGVPFRVLGRQGQWIRIRHADGDEGWVHENLVW